MIESTIGWTRKVEVIEAMEEGEEVQLKVRGRGVWVCWDIWGDTVDGSEIWRSPPGMVLKPCLSHLNW